jgi:hypothetical protein
LVVGVCVTFVAVFDYDDGTVMMKTLKTIAFYDNCFHQVISIIANSSSTATLRQPDTGKPPMRLPFDRLRASNSRNAGKASCDGISWNSWPNDMCALVLFC